MELQERLQGYIREARSKLREYLRVIKIATKPGRDEYETTIKITGLGIIIIGLVGFLFYLASKMLGGA